MLTITLILVYPPHSTPYLYEHREHVLETSLHAVSSFVPPPSVEQILIHRSFVDKYMLRELCWVVVQEVAQGVYSLCDCRGEERVLLRQLLGQRNERLQRSCLSYGASKTRSKFVVLCTEVKCTLKEGIGSWAMLGDALDCAASFE